MSYNVGKSNPNYKGNKALFKQVYYCLICDKIISHQTALYGTGLCKSCCKKRQ